MKKLTIEKKLLLHDVQVRRLNLKRFRKLILVFLLLKNCLLPGTDNVCTQISKQIF